MQRAVVLLVTLMSAQMIAQPAIQAQSRPERYRASIQALAEERAVFAKRWAEGGTVERAFVLVQARERLVRAITDELATAWVGTPWAFHGTSETPGEGSIACGYYVTTVLRDAGLRIERVRLAQQASERIVQTLAEPRRIRRFHDRPAEEVVAYVERSGRGVYVVGLDFHVGLLVHDGEAVRFCHSSVLPPGTVVCESAREAGAMMSRYHVVGRILGDAQIADWLENRLIPTLARR